MTTTLKIDFVSDVVCPWCAVGLASLEQAAARMQDTIALDWRFQPFELNPQMGAAGEDIDEHLARKYGGTREQRQAARAALDARGAAVGFTFGRRERTWNTFTAHRLLHWAGLEGADRQHALKRALLEAYHRDGRNVGDAAVLVDAATRVGLDAQRAAEIAAGDAYADDVRAAERHWIELGIRSVPAVVVNDRHLISGGQPPEVFEDALRRIAAGA